MNKVRAISWLGSARQWHWMSSAVCLVGMILFSVTGITLNHASSIKVTPQVTVFEKTLPEELLGAVNKESSDEHVSGTLAKWLTQELNVSVTHGKPELSEDELYLSLPRPGGDAWLTLDRATGEIFYESTDRGWIAFFNDLHKGRHTGLVWIGFIDVFAIACVLFSLTGLWLLAKHAKSRPSTWPLVALGVVLPWVLILLFMH